MHSTPLITTIVGGLVLAYLLGMLAQRLKISPLVGYLAAGVLAGPLPWIRCRYITGTGTGGNRGYSADVRGRAPFFTERSAGG